MAATRAPSPSPRSSLPNAAEDSARRCAGAFSNIRNARLLTRLLRSPIVQASARLWRGQSPSTLRPLGGGLDAFFVDLRREPNNEDRLHRYYTVLMLRTGDFADFSTRRYLGTQFIVRMRAIGGAA
jgi:hypothetical protein